MYLSECNAYSVRANNIMLSAVRYLTLGDQRNLLNYFHREIYPFIEYHRDGMTGDIDPRKVRSVYTTSLLTIHRAVEEAHKAKITPEVWDIIYSLIQVHITIGDDDKKLTEKHLQDAEKLLDIVKGKYPDPTRPAAFKPVRGLC